jgi:hypothetical protein
MERDSRRPRYVLAAVGGLVLLAAVAFFLSRGEQGEDEFGTSVVRWQAPDSGATAVSYQLRIQEVGAATEDTFQVVAQPGPAQSFAFTRARPGHEYRACIAGIDAQGRQGPWSAWSPVYRRGAVAKQP